MNELKRKRKELGITQLQAANACGVSLRTYQTYEETHSLNATYDYLLNKLEEICAVETNRIISIKLIRQACRNVFPKDYPEVKCAYLYGSYARGEATGKSDVDLLVVLDKPIGLRYFRIGEDFENILHKEVDIQSYEQLINNAPMLKDILVEGIKIYAR